MRAIDHRIRGGRCETAYRVFAQSFGARNVGAQRIGKLCVMGQRRHLVPVTAPSYHRTMHLPRN